VLNTWLFYIVRTSLIVVFILLELPFVLLTYPIVTY